MAKKSAKSKTAATAGIPLKQKSDAHATELALIPVAKVRNLGDLADWLSRDVGPWADAAFCLHKHDPDLAQSIVMELGFCIDETVKALRTGEFAALKEEPYPGDLSRLVRAARVSASDFPDYAHAAVPALLRAAERISQGGA